MEYVIYKRKSVANIMIHAYNKERVHGLVNQF